MCDVPSTARGVKAIEVQDEEGCCLGEKGGLHGGGPTAEGRAGFLKFKLEWVRSKPSGRNNDTKISASPPKK